MTSQSSSQHPAIRSFSSARYVYLFFCVACLLSLIAFGFQFQFVDENGVRFFDDPIGQVHVFSHLMRALVSGILALALRRYLRCVKAIRNDDPNADAQLSSAIGHWWNRAVLSVALVVGFGAIAVYVQITYSGRPRPVEYFTAGSEPQVTVEFRLAEFLPGEGLTEHTNKQTGASIWLYDTPLITNIDIVEATTELSPSDTAGVSMTFTAQAASRISKATEGHKDRPLAILIDGEVITTPIIRSPFGSGAMISMDTMEDATKFARAISGNTLNSDQ